MTIFTRTKRNFAAHGLKIETLCLVCFKKEETSLHALWHCHSLEGVRFDSGIGDLDCGLDSRSFFDFAQLCMERLDTAVFELLCVVWWRIWFRRNQIVHF